MYGFGDTMPFTNGLLVSRPYEEYRADFVLVGQRALREDGSAGLIRLFRQYIECPIDDAEARQKECERKLRLYRGAFDTQVVAMKSITGAAFLLTEPYALFPSGKYLREEMMHHKREIVRGRPTPADAIEIQYQGYGRIRRRTGGQTQGGSWR